MMTVSSSSRSSTLTDPTLQPFLSPTFSAITYLNTTLPSTIATPTPALSTLASSTQSHISTLSALTARLSQTLTSLTDDILRSSTRLTYEIELLRGDALSLTESLAATGVLAPAIAEFVPDGLLAVGGNSHEKEQEEGEKPAVPPTESTNLPSTPDAITRLRTLQHVKSRLQSTTQTFSLALSWPFPPSLLSSLISISDPTLEAKGQEACSRLRQEVLDMMAEDSSAGLEKARARVEELREVVGVWKGTGEEKARGKWVDGLARVVEEEERKRSEGVTGRRRGVSAAGRKAVEEQQGRPSAEISRGPGFLRNLQRLREEIYME
jgi:hypothetical protein